MTTLVLTRADVAALLTVEQCFVAVEEAFRKHAEGGSLRPAVLGVPVEGGGFHIKTAGLALSRSYFAAKLNANFPGNPAHRSLPTIQGVVALCDATDGRLLALMDSIEITTLRTAAATAVAAKYLARENSRTVTIAGCGVQGRAQLRAIRAVCPIAQVFVYDTNSEGAGRFASEMSRELRLPVSALDTLCQGARESDVVITCTPSRTVILGIDDVRPGTFIAAVGADSEHKQELDPLLMARSKVIVDVLEQCATIGDLHHALEAGVMTADDVHGDLGEIVSQRKCGRADPTEIIVFDSTGTALEDVGAAAVVYERALELGCGVAVNLNGLPEQG